MARRTETRHFVTCDGCGLEVVREIDGMPYGWSTLELRLTVTASTATAPASAGAILAGDFCTSCKRKLGQVFAALRSELADRFRASLKRDEPNQQGSSPSNGEPIKGVP